MAGIRKGRQEMGRHGSHGHKSGAADCLHRRTAGSVDLPHDSAERRIESGESGAQEMVLDDRSGDGRAVRWVHDVCARVAYGESEPGHQ